MPQAPFGYGPYEPPSSSRGRPAVIVWYRVYAAMTLLLYVGMLVGWTMINTGDRGHGPETAIMLLIVLGAALVFGGFYAVAAMVPYKPWGWTVGLIAICLGLSSCLVVFAVPLLIYWMKPEAKAAFGRL
jgi:hypothetical protein